MIFKINQGRAIHPALLIMIMTLGFGGIYYTMTTFSETTAIMSGIVISILLAGAWSLHSIIWIDFSEGKYNQYLLLFGQKFRNKQHQLKLPLSIEIKKEIKYDDLKHIAILSDQSDQKIILAKRRNMAELEKIIAPLLQEDTITKS